MNTTVALGAVSGPDEEECSSVPKRIQMSLDFDLSYVNFSPLPASQQVKVTFTVFFGLTILIGLLANVVVIIWIIKGKPKRSSIDVYFVSLSIADLVCVLTYIPLQIALLWVNSNWGAFPEASADELCKGGQFFQSASVVISSLTLVAIAIDRYLAICHPITHYKMRDRKVMITTLVVITLWIVGVTFSAVDASGVRLTLPFSEVDNYRKYYDEQEDFLSNEILYVPDVDYYAKNQKLIPASQMVNSTCEDVTFHRACLHPQRDKTNIVILCILIYIVPVAVMGYCYISICHRLWVRKRMVDIKSSQRPSLVLKSTIKTTMILMLIIMIFGLLWLPYWSRQMYEVHNQELPPDEPVHFSLMDMSFVLLTYLSIISSPIIYLLTDRDFQKCLKNGYRRLTECSRSELLLKDSGSLSSNASSRTKLRIAIIPSHRSH